MFPAFLFIQNVFVSVPFLHLSSYNAKKFFPTSDKCACRISGNPAIYICFGYQLHNVTQPCVEHFQSVSINFPISLP